MGTPIRPEPQQPTTLSGLLGQRERERQANPVPDTLRLAADATKDAEPTRAARVLRVQGKTAWPTDFIDRNLEVLELEVDKPDFNAERFWRESPEIAAWMAQDPTRVAAARGRDMERMGRVEGYLKAIGTELERNTITTDLTEPAIAAMFGRATPEQETEIQRLRQRQASLPDVLGTRGFLAGIPIAAVGQLPITLDLYKGAAGGAAVGAVVGAAVGSVVPGVGTGAGAVRGAFLGSRAGVVAQGVKLETANAFLDYREMEGVDRETAAVGAIIAGTMAGALELLPFENAAKAIPGLRRLGKDGIRELLMAPTTRRLIQRYAGQVMSQMAAEGFTEGLQELVQVAVGVLTQRYAEGTLGQLSTATILREIFAPENLSRMASAARTGAQSGGGFGAATGGISTAMDYPAVRRAELNAQRMQAAAEAIHGNDREEAVTLAKDAPEAMKDAVAAVGTEGVFYDINEFTAYWQTQTTPDGEAANPREVALALGVTPDEYDAAVESGAPINIPTQNLLVDALATTAHRQWFVDNMRVTPNELSKAEAAKQREQAMAPVEDVADVAEMPTREQEAEAGVAALRERVTAELRQARVGPEESQASVALWTEAAKTAIARNPDLPVAEVLRRFERVQVVAQPVAAYPDGKAVSRFEVTGETMDRGDGTQVPVLKATRTARANAARLETLAAEKGEARLTERQREQLAAARQSLADAEAVNKTLTPVDFAALRGPVDVQGMTPEQRAAVRIESSRESLLQAAYHGTPHTYVGEVRITRANGAVEWYELGGRLPAEVEAEIQAGTARATDFPAGRFRLDKIGTGEGAQAYGWGLYFAESQDVAEGYRQKLANQIFVVVDGQRMAWRTSIDIRDNAARATNDAIEYLQAAAQDTLMQGSVFDIARDIAGDLRSDAESQGRMNDAMAATRAIEAITDLERRGARVEQAGALYRVDIPDEAVARMLDWDKKLSEQDLKAFVAAGLRLPDSARVTELKATLAERQAELADAQDALDYESARRLRQDVNALQAEVESATAVAIGRDAYQLLSKQLGGDKDASLALLAAGIPGIKYLDAGSRGAGDGTRNLVVFDDALVTITHRNGEPVTAQERADFLAQDIGETVASQRLRERGPVRAPRGNTYMGVIEKYTVPNPSTDAPVLKGNSPLIGASTNAGNADRQSEALDALFAKHTDPLASEAAWVALANDAFSLNRVPMPPYRTIALVQGGAQAIADEIGRLSEGMRREAEEGLATAQRFGRVYAEGRATPDVTAKAFLWSFLSRGVSPYVQEGAFLDAIVSDELTAIMQDAVQNGWNDALADRYKAWASTAIPSGSPGRGTQHNLNAFGTQFMRVMTQRHPDSGNRTGLEIIHQMIADGTPSAAIRREFLKRGDGAGIDNKVVSFTLLLLGRTDVLVLDRVQVRNQFNDGRFDGQNIYDAELNENGVPISGSGFAEMTFGHKGLLYYEAMERALEPRIVEAYRSLGLEGSLGRYHWDSWLLASNQEVGHASVEGLLRDAEGNAAPYVGTFVRQGKYANYDYGFRYGVLPDGSVSTVVELLDGSGAVVVPREVMADAKHPTRKLLSKLATVAKKRAPQYGTTEPWTAGLTPTERAQYDEGIRSAGTPAPDVWQYDPNAVGRENASGTPEPDVLFQRAARAGGAALPESIDVDGVQRPTQNSLRQGMAEPRGAFIAPAGRVDGPRLVALFKERNQSTFLHETAHAFLDLWTDLAADPAASPEFRELVSGVRAELGATGNERLSVAQEEAFAGMFLDYAKSGRAPSVSLRQAFASFAAFLTKLWSFVKGEIVPASEDVRDLLDRLLATDDAIAEARGEFMAPLFPDDAQVNAAFVKARTEAEEQTRTEAMRAVVRAEQEWWKRTTRQVTEEVRENVNRDPAYIARQILTTGRMPNGDALDAGSPLLSKLNRAQIVALIGEDATKQLPRGKTGAVYNTQGGGLDLSIAAEVLGYANGTELLAALQQTQPIEEHVANVVKATMAERYGDPLTDGTVPQVAVDALHNDSLDRMRQLEMEAILRDHPEAFREAMVMAASRPLNIRDLKESARERLANRPLRTIRPAEYLSAERKAGQEAVRAVARGEWAKAVQAKAKQRFAAAMYAEAVAAKEAVAKFQELVTKVFGPDERIAKSRNLDIVMAARQVLASVGIGRRENDTQFYLAQLAEYDPETAATLDGVVADFNVAPRDDFKALTFAEFENVQSAVQELWDTAKQAETLTVAGRKIAKAEAVADMTSVLVTMRDSAVEGAGIERVAEFRDKVNKGVLTAKASLRRVESWIDLMDGGDINGPFRRYLFATLRDRTAEKSAANTADLLAYDGMLAGIRPTLTTVDIAAPELGRRWVFKGKAHLLGTLLHTGNPSNKAMLLNGRGWTMDGWTRFRDRMVAEGALTPADFDFVQGVWNLFEAKKPEAQKVYRRMFGRYFDEITREGFTIQFPDGTARTYAGGYTPATKDPDASTKAEQRAADAMLEEAYGMRFPTVQRGFTIGRVQNFEPLLLSLDIVPKHLDAVNKFIYLAEPVREVGRLLRDRTLRAEMDRVNPAIVNDLLMPWLQRTTTQVVQTPSASPALAKYVDPMAKYLRTTAGASFMFLNVANTLEQATGLSVAAVRVNPKYLSMAQAAVLRDGAQVTAVVEQDNPFMRERITTQFTEVRRRIDEITTNPNVFQQAQAFAAEHAYILQSTAQNHVDRIVWYGSYLESLDAGLSVGEARAKANADVRLTQGSFEAVDVSRIETGNPWWRLIAMFAGYFNMLANLNATEMQKAVDAAGLKKSMPRLFAVYMLGFAVPILTSNLIRKAMLGRAAMNDVDGDDEWGYLDDFFAWFFGEQARAGAAMVPAAGSTINYVANLFDDKAFNDQLTISPAISFVEAAGRGVKAGYDVLSGESLARRDIRDMLSLFSLMSRIPATGFARPLTYLYDVEEGRAQPSGPVDFTRGMLSGAPGR